LTYRGKEKDAILSYGGRRCIKLYERSDIKDGDTIRVFLKVL